MILIPEFLEATSKGGVFVTRKRIIGNKEIKIKEINGKVRARDFHARPAPPPFRPSLEIPSAALYSFRAAINLIIMDQDFLIRDAAAADLEKVAALVRDAYLEFRPFFPEKVWQAWMDNVSQTLRAPAGMLIVAVAGGVIEGVIKFYADASQSGMGHWPEGVAAIRILAVSPAARGRGYGTRLAWECLHRAREMQISTIFLFTAEFMHAARHIYEKLGFQRAPEFDPHPGPIAYRLDL